MKNSILIAFGALLLTACTNHKNFSAVKIGMTKDEVVITAGEE
jgi:hypothetical protein